MARLPRLFVPGMPQLLLQRGNDRLRLFDDEADHERYLSDLREAARESSVSLHAYVLMPDHVHLLVTAADEGGSGAMMQRLGRRYVRYFNDRHRRSGTLWEGRYRSTVVEPTAWLLACYRYLELNPVRAGLVSDPVHYGWSSCGHHLGVGQDPLIADHPLYWSLGNTPFERQATYRRMLDAGSPRQELEAIRYAAHRGWMLGEPPASRSGTPPPNRRSQPLPKGRPRRTEDVGNGS
ncbi:transposase [Uliginosibacterium sp. H1]|uniref:transposase n=1 Tax=Uliginosibacterium sp. H1 TaxID=3114757 RepID=UPI002E1901FD|nr:transposase [Uliginosibacterium sp. H1]